MSRGQLTPEEWARLSPLVDAMLEQPIGRRQAFIADTSSGDATLARELTRFLDADVNSTNDRDTSLFEAAAHERSQLLSNALFDATIDLLAVLQESLGGRYLVEREIGGGGMSRVFIASEPALDRKVVIKVLPRELTEAINAERLTREIKVAASLQQANIVPVLAAGTAAGFPYYTMPLVEGQSLRDRLDRDGALPVSEVISILRDVARALAFAHGRGIIHRDVKPGNILLSDRTAVVTDFGIAKAIGDARARSSDAADLPSRTGSGFGTPSYIAPEQAAGDPDTDYRADIYSFGCVAFELFTGTPPFSGSTERSVIEAHFHEMPPSVTQVRPDVPEAIARLIASCLEKDPSRRPQTANDVLLLLDNSSSPALPYDRLRGRRALIGATMVVVIAIAIAGLSYYRPESIAPEPLTFAAVPFRNAAHDTALDYRSDGIGDEILNGMSRINGVQVVGRSTAFRYKERNGVQPPDVTTIERTLGARLLLTGTLRESDGRVIVSTQLNDSASRGEIWSDSFTRNAADIGSITSEIVKRIGETLRARFGARITLPPLAATPGTTNAAALDMYLIGQAQLRRRGSGISQSIISFQRAIDLDSSFARAHAALAIALELDPFFNGTPPRLVINRAVAEAKHALAFDSTLADPHAALGSAHAYLAEWAESDAEMRRAIDLDPDNASLRQTFARLLIIRGFADEAIEQLRKARNVEPTSPLVAAWLSYAFFLAGYTDSALTQSERAIELDPTNLPTVNLGSLVNLALGRTQVARQLIRVPDDHGMTNAAYIHARLGDTASANRIVREMEQRSPRPWFIDVSKASILLATGDSGAALSALERSEHATGPTWVFFIPLGDPAYDLVRHSPRFAALLRRANIDARIIRSARARASSSQSN